MVCSGCDMQHITGRTLAIRRVGYGYQVYDVRTGVGASRTVWATLDLAKREQERLVRAG